MIIWKNTKSIETRSDILTKNWYEGQDEEVYVVDETTVEGQALTQKVMQHAPYFDFVLDEDGDLIDVTPTERPPLPPQPLTEEQQRLLDLELAMAQILGGGGGV